MPPLAELQQRFARAVMEGDIPAAMFAGPVPPAEALSIHRDTILGGLINALRLSHPTVDALVGTEFFDQACLVFAETHLPRTASLANYGEGFGDFLAGFARGLAYLPDVARLDRAVEAALHAPARMRRFMLDAAAAIAVPQSLAVLHLRYPAEEIRAALGDDAALARIVLAPAERFVLVWRKEFEVAVRRVDAAAGRFLASLLAGDSAEAAFHAASAGTSEAQALHAIQTEIFASPFCTVIPTQETLSP